MTSYKPLTYAAATLGLVLGSLTVSAGAAVAAVPTCQTTVVGVLPSGNLVSRDVTNTHVDTEHVSTSPLPFAVSNMVFLSSNKTADGYVGHVNTFTTGGQPRNIDVATVTAAPTQTVTVATTYSNSVAARLVAGSGRYYVYGVDKHGNLKRWTRVADSTGHVGFASPKLVARHLGGLKTLSYSWSYKIGGGWKDVLYGTTRSGALKQFKLSWRKPGSPKVSTIKRSGFASYTGLSLSFCNSNTKYLSIIGIDRVHNRARWYTVKGALAPGSATVKRRGFIGTGSDWRLHATF